MGQTRAVMAVKRPDKLSGAKSSAAREDRTRARPVNSMADHLWRLGLDGWLFIVCLHNCMYLPHALRRKKKKGRCAYWYTMKGWGWRLPHMIGFQEGRVSK